MLWNTKRQLHLLLTSGDISSDRQTGDRSTCMLFSCFTITRYIRIFNRLATLFFPFKFGSKCDQLKKLFTCNFIDGKWQSYGRIYINVIFVKTFEQFKNKLGVISFRIEQFFIKWFHNFFVFLVANNRFIKLAVVISGRKRFLVQKFLLAIIFLTIECENSMKFFVENLAQNLRNE